ncbi:hypothetical protein GCM10010168_93230 [Actinoplanes ianthinogenes]|uniref:hypothetical protein n=1 Tax=Actinoplanes ianthinogenes TaxID=122358 RepID=UPI0016703E65|nr:hypothetical protein [Actinoplanes ianthinogenes]GGR59736.1 hypothetical protein GCM10010168_93230 [Actinoplanes ianthinogenes]
MHDERITLKEPFGLPVGCLDDLRAAVTILAIHWWMLRACRTCHDLRKPRLVAAGHRVVR